MRTPSRASISARIRAIDQLRRSATGCSKKGAITRKAASLFPGGGRVLRWPSTHCDATVQKVAAPQANRVLEHTERRGNPGTGPAGQRQQRGAGAVRFPAITRAGQYSEGGALFFGCRE